MIEITTKSSTRVKPEWLFVVRFMVVSFPGLMVCQVRQQESAQERGAARFTKDGTIPPTKEVHCLVNWVQCRCIRRTVRALPSMGVNATHCSLSTFYPVIRWSVENQPRRSDLISLLTYSKLIRPATHRNDISNCERSVPHFLAFARERTKNGNLPVA